LTSRTNQKSGNPPFAAPEAKKLTASPDGVITNESVLREFMARAETKDDKKDLNSSTSMANQVIAMYFLTWTQSYDRELQRQRYRIYNTTSSLVRVESTKKFFYILCKNALGSQLQR
jgi:hypothetical protein